MDSESFRRLKMLREIAVSPEDFDYATLEWAAGEGARHLDETLWAKLRGIYYRAVTAPSPARQAADLAARQL